MQTLTGRSVDVRVVDCWLWQKNIAGGGKEIAFPLTLTLSPSGGEGKRIQSLECSSEKIVSPPGARQGAVA
jgi:hypothetical protein